MSAPVMRDDDANGSTDAHERVAPDAGDSGGGRHAAAADAHPVAPLATRPPGDAPDEERRAAVYDERCAGHVRQREAAARQVRLLGNLRLATFMAALAAGVWAEVSQPGERVVPLLLAALFLASFLRLLALHRRAESRRQRFAGLHDLNAEGRARVTRDWRSLPTSWLHDVDPSHPYGADLDIGGQVSIARILGPVGTPAGIERLRTWLLEPASPAEVAARQAAVAELASAPDLRDELALHARLTRAVGADRLGGVIEWAEGGPWLLRRRWLVWVAWLVPLATAVTVAMHLLGVVRFYWIAPMAVAAMVHWRYRPTAHGIFDVAFPEQGVFRRYPQLFQVAAGATFQADLLRRLQARLAGGEASKPAHEAMRRLERTMELADARHSRMSHFPLQILTLWDVHVLWRLERWQRDNGFRLRDWLDALGRLEALGALAALAHDHPDWSFPEFSADGPAVVRAEALGHPLIPGRDRVTNDLEVGPPGTYVLVTGSNMSGKSTLLRALGVNVVLAQAGAPVCARRLRLPPLAVHTSMRVQDSLAAGVSHFMARLLRLKEIVGAAAEARASGRTMLYLLDEILQGTNTAERLAASRRVISHLVRRGAIGVVTTHDLALADAEELSDAVRTVHFRETFRSEDGRSSMSFDYRLRPGVATSRNALRLMELVGLDV